MDYISETAPPMVPLKSPLRTSPTIGKLAEALAKAQGDFDTIEKTKEADTGTYKYRYADLGDVLAIVRPTLAGNGIALMQPTINDHGVMIVLTRLIHVSGEWIESEYIVGNAMQIAHHQKIGASLTYARRYALCSMIGVAAEEDVDANDNATISDEVEQPKRGRPPKTVVQSHDPQTTKPLPPIAGTKGRTHQWGTTTTAENDTFYNEAVKSIKALKSFNEVSTFWKEQIEPVLHKYPSSVEINLVELRDQRLAMF